MRSELLVIEKDQLEKEDQLDRKRLAKRDSRKPLTSCQLKWTLLWAQ